MSGPVLLPDPEADVHAAVAELRRFARPLATDADLDPLIARIGSARCVLLGEASHGTSEFYTWRARLSRRLIAEHGFSFIAVEGDWPDCERVDRFINLTPDAPDEAREVLFGFDRWPTWMWANEEMVELVQWLRDSNLHRDPAERVGFYGLDVYSLWESMAEVIRYLETTDRAAAERARSAYECFAPYAEEGEHYARATALVPTSCADAVVRVLSELRERAQHFKYLSDRHAQFVAEQNALVAKNAETYYRSLVQRGPESWNVRDQHMAETLDRLFAFHGPSARGIVWAHNTHVGDARYTDMVDEGELNLGQLARERYGDEQVVLVGFSSHRGSVIAGDRWGAPMKHMPVPVARAGSVEDALHRMGLGDALVLFEAVADDSVLLRRRPHRAIGVVYRPSVERYGNYVPTVLPRRYDALLYVEHAKALRPLHPIVHDTPDLPETYPFGV